MVMGEWVEKAACVSFPTNIFYPEKGHGAAMAKHICWHCPVQLDCLTYSLVQNEPHGVWGGLSEQERKDLRRTMRRRYGAGSSPTLWRNGLNDYVGDGDSGAQARAV